MTILLNGLKKVNMAGAFNPTDQEDVIRQFREMMEWVQGNDQFLNAAKAEFAAGVDGWLVAYSKVNVYTAVTHEVYAPDARKKVPIPNVCKEFDVRYVDTFKMLRDLGVRFI
jgi:hypothetical protein